MTPDDTRQLLRYCGSVDQWLRATTTDEAALMVAGWTDLLADVPHDFALGVARSHYSQQGNRTITPADLLAAWREHARREQQEADQAYRTPELDGAAPAIFDGGSAAQYLRDLTAAVVAGLDPDTVPRPVGVPVLTKAADERARRCVYHAMCACSHDRCRDGWSDDEAVIVNALGRRYPAAQRCPHCLDALKMAEERGVAKRPSRASVRR